MDPTISAPHKSAPVTPNSSPVKAMAAPATAAIKHEREGTPGRSVRPPMSPKTPWAQPSGALNFAICGGTDGASEHMGERYLELQNRSEEPDLIMTRSLRVASWFALDEEDFDKDV
ncbi:hypothetical protein K438DRAFT_1787093 [Mycena galopus ATCC 62051]|nr:hypothetical protein K438DRAFT_1787093 [Mycena galopus ATCC 62051]